MKIIYILIMIILTGCNYGYFREWTEDKGVSITYSPHINDYPFNVCISKQFSKKEIRSLETAVYELNKSYKSYIGRKNIDKTLVPETLFEIISKEPCKVYIDKAHLDNNQLGHAKAGDVFNSLSVEINQEKHFETYIKNKKDSKVCLKILFKHELMHTIGLGHIKESDIMNQSMKHCLNKECVMSNLEWNIFLEVYLYN